MHVPHFVKEKNSFLPSPHGKQLYEIEVYNNYYTSFKAGVNLKRKCKYEVPPMQNE